MAIETKIIENESVWEGFLQNHPEANFLHSWLWSKFHESLNHKVIRTGFYENGKLMGVMLAIVEEARRAKYLVVPGGPIIDWNNKKLTKAFVEELRNICKIYKCSFARVRTQLEENNESINIFKTLGFKKAPMYLHAELTSQLDIDKSEEELLSAMRKSTRYEVKKAKNLNINIIKNGQKYIDKFYELQVETAKRQKFVPFSKKFLLNQFDIFLNNNQAILYTAEFEKKILAQAFIVFYGNETVYHYGASTDDGRNYPGAYLIQWEAILEAKRRGVKRYNLWGVSPIGSADHRFSGLSLFKRGFGGVDVQYLPAQDLIVNPPAYYLNYIIEKSRRLIRKV